MANRLTASRSVRALDDKLGVTGPRHSSRRLGSTRPAQGRRRKPRLQFEWATTLSRTQWAVYRSAINALRNANVPFLLGGGFALAIYTGRWRDTKDIDFYIARPHRRAAVDALSRAGFDDYFATLPYDRKWIYRSTKNGMIVDIIWSMANQRAQVDEAWFRRSTAVSIRGEALRVLPIEEFVWCKLYILQRDHCDWTDVLNVIHTAAGLIDWDYLLRRLEGDWPLLKALLTLYGWLCPTRSRQLPESLRRKLRLDQPRISAGRKFNRIRLLDSRGWFAALLPANKPLEI